MTIIINGSTIIHNRTGKSIDSYIGNGTNVSGSTTTISDTGAGHILAILQPQSSSNYACNIPSVAIGTQIDIFIDTSLSSGGWFYLPSGETLPDGVTDRGGISASISLIKISATTWLRSA